MFVIRVPCYVCCIYSEIEGEPQVFEFTFELSTLNSNVLYAIFTYFLYELLLSTSKLFNILGAIPDLRNLSAFLRTFFPSTPPLLLKLFAEFSS